MTQKLWESLLFPCYFFTKLTVSEGTAIKQQGISPAEAQDAIDQGPSMETLAEANLNNQIGVPYNILNAPANSKYVVLEMGMQRLGEIDYFAIFCLILLVLIIISSSKNSFWF